MKHKLLSLSLVALLLLGVGCKEKESASGDSFFPTLPPAPSPVTLVEVNNVAELTQALDKVVAGDTIQLADGTYLDFALIAKKDGTKDAPILITAKNPGKVFFSGNTWVELRGDYTTLSGIYFKDGARNPSDWKSHGQGLVTIYADHCTVTECMFYRYDKAHTSYVCTFLDENKHVPLYATISHCAFIEKPTNDQVINLNNTTQKELTGTPGVPMYHRITRCYFSNPPKSGNAGGGIRVGYWRKDYGRCLIDHNLFERQDSEAEIITSKSMENVYYRNTYINCRGTMNFRHGDKQVAIDNVYIGTDTKYEYGGMYIWGSNHIVAGNYFNLPRTLGSRGNAAVYFNSGPEGSEHALAFNSSFIANTFENTNGADLDFASLYDRRVEEFGAANVKTPYGIKFLNNLFLANPPRRLPLMTDENNTFGKQSWTNNLYAGMPLGVSETASGLTEKSDLAIGDNYPIDATLLSAHLPYKNIEGIDLDFTKAINESKEHTPLMRKEVGPTWCETFPGSYADTGVFDGPTGSNID